VLGWESSGRLQDDPVAELVDGTSVAVLAAVAAQQVDHRPPVVGDGFHADPRHLVVGEPARGRTHRRSSWRTSACSPAPTVGLRKPDAGHREAFAMSSPAARSTTVSIVITLRPTRTTDVVVADRVAATSHHAFGDPRARKHTPGQQPRLPRAIRDGLTAPKPGKRRRDRPATTTILIRGTAGPTRSFWRS